MKHLLLAVFLWSQLAAATAPDTIAGKVYRSNITWKGTSPYFRNEDTIIFENSGRFVYLKYAWGQDLFPTPKVAVQAALPDGTYRYERITDTEARVRLAFDDGRNMELPLTFTSSDGGGTSRQSGPFWRQSSFFLTDIAAAKAVTASNLSMRGNVSPGRPLIVGFIVPGEATPPRVWDVPPGEKSHEVLIRVVGPSLSSFGIGEFWKDPDFELYRGNSLAKLDEGHNPDWEGRIGVGQSVDTGKGLRKIFGYLAAFPLLPESKDAADVVRLTPGAYTIVCNVPPNDTGGEALVEVYFLP